MATIQCCFYAKSLMRTVDITVILPTDKALFNGSYAQEPKRFKTLYLLHGIFGSCHDWVNGTRIARWAQTRDLAVVMPSGENRCYVDGPAPCDHFGAFIGEDLVEFTRRSFPLSDRREDTFIGGLSMGGYGALRNGLKYNETFGAIVGLSSAMMVDEACKATDSGHGLIGNRRFYEAVFGDLGQLEGSENDPYALVKGILAAGRAMPELYLACGTEDALILPANQKFDAFLSENGVRHTFVTGPGGHDWVFWDTFIEKALDWLPLGAGSEGVSSGHVTED